MGEIEVLRDVDYLETMPEEVEALLTCTGTTLDEVRGTVRSLNCLARPGKANAEPAGKLAIESCCGTHRCVGGAK